MKVFVINGYPRSGKDSFVEFCNEKYRCKNYSTVDIIKTCARLLGWNGVKDATSRKFLSDLKDLASKAFDTSMQMGIKEMLYAAQTGYDFFFIHAREPQEIEEFKGICNNFLHFNCKTIFIDRPGANDVELSNHSDKEVENYTYDYYVKNDGTLDDWRETAYEFITKQYNPIN